MTTATHLLHLGTHVAELAPGGVLHGYTLRVTRGVLKAASPCGCARLVSYFYRGVEFEKTEEGYVTLCARIVRHEPTLAGAKAAIERHLALCVAR